MRFIVRLLMVFMAGASVTGFLLPDPIEDWIGQALNIPFSLSLVWLGVFAVSVVIYFLLHRLHVPELAKASLTVVWPNLARHNSPVSAAGGAAG